MDLIFRKYDKDNSGALDEDEIFSLMGDIFDMLGISPKPTETEARYFLQSLDNNGDGLVQKN